MRSLWRILLTCLLLIAVPLKGMAAVGMVGCSPAHHGAAPQAQHEHGEVQQHGDTADAGSEHHASASAVPDKCSQCAPCCFSAMLLSAFELPTPVRQTHLVRTHVEVIYPSAHLPGLERPPRDFFA